MVPKSKRYPLLLVKGAEVHLRNKDVVEYDDVEMRYVFLRGKQRLQVKSEMTAPMEDSWSVAPNRPTDPLLPITHMLSDRCRFVEKGNEVAGKRWEVEELRKRNRST